MKKTKDMNKDIVLNGVTFNHDMTHLIKYPENKKSQFYYIPDDVTCIRSLSFENCRNLTTLFIPRTVESIDIAAFKGCSNLKNILLPKFSYFSFENGRLYRGKKGDGSEKKEDITDMVFFPDIDYRIPDDKTTMPDFMLFYPDGGLGAWGESDTKIEIIGTVQSVFIHKNVTKLSGAQFNAFDKLLQFTVDDENLFFKSVDGVVFSKDGTTLYKYPAGKEGTEYRVPEGVKIIGDSAFAHSTLKEIILPDSVTVLGDYAFGECSELEKFVLPSGLKTIGENTFQSCDLWMEEFVIPESVISIGKGAFADTGIDKITLNSTIDSIKADTFQNSCLKSIEIGPGVKYIGEKAFESSCLTKITIPDSVEVIDESAFEDCGSLKTVYIGRGVTDIRSCAFFNCTELERIDVDKRNPKYASIDGILMDKLNNCIEEYPPLAPMPSSFMKEVDGVIFWGNRLIKYPKDKPDSKYIIPEWVKDIEPYAFDETEKLEELILPDTWRTVPFQAFAYCPGIKRVKLSSNIWKIGWQAFKDCPNLEEVDLPSCLEIIGEEAFKECPSLKQINLPSGLKTIEEGAFLMCTGLKELDIPGSVSEIGDKAFRQCTGLKSIIFKNGLRKIGMEAFAGCDRLTKIVVPESITNIKELAFAYCKKLKSVTIPETVEEIEEGILKKCNSLEDVNLPNIKGDYFGGWGSFDFEATREEIPF